MSRFLPLVAFVLLLSACNAPTTPDVEFAAAVQIAVQKTLTAEVSMPAEAATQPSLVSSPEASTSTPLPPSPTRLVVTDTPVPAPTAVTEVTDQDRMQQVLAVSLVATEILPVNTDLDRYRDTAHFTFRYENKGIKAIRAFTGVTVFGDLFGRPQKTLNLTYDNIIQPGEVVIDDDKIYELNQFMDEDKWIETTEFENILFSFEPKSILFTDGNKLGTVE